MIINKAVKKTIRSMIRLNTLRQNNKIIREKIDFLKRERLFRCFPHHQVRPKVSLSTLRHRSDGYYYDFFYSVYGYPDPGFIPLTTYYLYIEPVLNTFSLLTAVKDKNFYDRFLADVVRSPETYLRKINNTLYDQEFHTVCLSNDYLERLLQDADRLILKPSIDSGGGKSIMLFTRAGRTFQSKNTILDADLLSAFPDFVLQKSVVQHQFFGQFNPDSNNTLRVLTYRSVLNNKTYLLHRLLRVGKKGSFLDHDNFGGIAIGINKDGYLNNFGCNAMGLRLNTFNGIEFEKERLQVPFLNQVEEMAVQIAEKIHYGRFLAMDFTVDQTGKPIFLEVNCRWNGVSQYQMNLGSLFKHFTDEILSYCLGKDYECSIGI